MLIACTPVILKKQDLEKKLNTRSFFNPERFLTRGKPITKVELKYVEYLIMEYEMKLGMDLGRFLKGRKEQITSKIRLIGNGSTGDISFLETDPETQSLEIAEDMVQKKNYGPEEMRKEAQYAATVVCRKLTGRRCREIRLTDTLSIYRPFWVVYYGEPRKDGKVLCCPYGADGFTIKR